MPGPARQPSAILRARGSSLAAKRAAEEAAAPPGRPDPPDHLTALAREEWHRVVEDLETLELVSRVDRAALEGYVAAYELHRIAMADVARDGATQEVLTKAGGVMVRAHPAASIAKSALTEMRSYLREFGLTPATRAKVAAARQAMKDQAGDNLPGDWWES